MAVTPDPDPEREVREELDRRLIDPPPIPPDFDPERITQGQLAELRLPPRPDPKTAPELHRLWLRIFSPPVTFHPLLRAAILAQVTLTLPLRIAPPLGEPSNEEVVAGLPGRSRVGGSLNWAGPVVLANRGERYSIVGGSWRAPAALVPAVATPTVASEYRASVWVGLDGYRRFTLGLPQIGTTHAVKTNGAPVTPEAWFQWWVRNQNYGPVTLTPPIPVAAGEEILAMVAALTPALGVMLLPSQTAPGGHHAIVLLLAPTVNGAFVEIAGTTAEWILERPTELGGTALYALPNFERTVFEECAAGLQFAPSFLTPARQRLLHGVRLVRMLDRLPASWRSVVVAPAGKLSATSAEVAYRGP